MVLSTDLISQFVKATAYSIDDKKKEAIIYGIISKQKTGDYVKLDGSEMLTPVSSTTVVKDGERVMVMIKNHSAVVTGNLSSPAAQDGDLSDANKKISEFETVIAGKVSAKEFDAEKGRIDTLVSDNVLIKQTLTANEIVTSNLTADNVTIKATLKGHDAEFETIKTQKLDATFANLTYATINNLTVVDQKVHNLTGDYGAFKQLAAEQFSANDASIKTLSTEKLSATDADLKYANIDFSNIGKSTMEEFYANSGLIKDVVIGDATISGTLVGVTISGELITGGTIVADKLVIKGEDGLYYKLNTDGITTESQQTDYNSLNGQVIKAKSIVATKILVDDLVAFDATIGGFHITDKSIYSGVKESVDNTTTGLYLDNAGQMAFGDAFNYVKYFKDTDDKYKLLVSAQDIIFGSNNENLSTVIDQVKGKVTNNETVVVNLIADVNGFKSTVESTYTSKQEMSEVKTEILQDSQSKADKAVSDAIAIANANTATALKSYSTTEQTTVAINQAKDSLKLSVDQTTNLILNFNTNMFDNCLQSIGKDSSDTTVHRLENMPIGIDISTLRNKDICLSVDIDAKNLIPKSLGGFVGAMFNITYSDDTVKMYSVVFVPGMLYLQYPLSGLTTSISQRIYTTHKTEDKEIKSVSMLSLEINCNGDIEVFNPKVEFGKTPTGLEFAQKELGNEQKRQEIRLQKTEFLLTPTEITALVNERIGGDGELKTMKFVLNKNGGEFYDGGLSIFNKSGDKVLYADVNGNLTIQNLNAVNGAFTGTINALSGVFSGHITYAQIDSANINIAQDARIGNILYLGSATSTAAYRYISLNGGTIVPNSDVVGDVIYYRSGQVGVHAQSLVTIDAGGGVNPIGVQANANTGTLHLSGYNGIYANGAIISSSDERLKKNIVEADISSLIDEIDIKSFHYRNGGSIQLGVIAQSLLESKYREYVVSVNPDGYYAVNYNAINMALVQKVQKMDQNLKNAIEKIAELEGNLLYVRN